MHAVRGTLLTLATTVALAGATHAQQSNPVTSDPPVNAIGRDSETSPGTPNRQNSAPGVRGRYDYGPSYSAPAYADDIYYDPPRIVVTPQAGYVEID